MPKSVLRRGLEGFHPYVPGEQPPDGAGWVKLNTNESPLPPSPRVTVGNGGDELIELWFRAFAGAGDTVAFPTPTYPLFEPLCRIHEAEPSRHPTEDFAELPPSLAADPAPLKFIVNPNSPSGALFDQDAVEGAVAASSGVVVIDEAYVDFAPHSCLPLLERYDNVLLLRTFS